MDEFKRQLIMLIVLMFFLSVIAAIIVVPEPAANPDETSNETDSKTLENIIEIGNFYTGNILQEAISGIISLDKDIRSRNETNSTD